MVLARCCPPELTMPLDPPGTVIVSVAPGTSGPVAWYWSSDGDSTAQLPATGGSRVGMGALGARSVENCTEMVEPAATLEPVGDMDTTLRAGGGAVGLAEAGENRTWTATTSPAAATTSATTQMVGITHHRLPFACRTCPPWAMAGGILPGPPWLWG